MLPASPARQNIADLTDEILIRKYQQTGNNRFFAELYHRYAHLVFGACLKWLGNREESRDMSMTIFEKIMAQPPAEEIVVFKSWLHKFIQNECFYYVRNRTKRGEMAKIFQDFEKTSNHFMENEGFVQLINEGASLSLEHAINMLSEEQRICINLFFLKEKTYKEITALTGYSDKQVKSFLQNGKRKLKIFMAQNA